MKKSIFLLALSVIFTFSTFSFNASASDLPNSEEVSPEQLTKLENEYDIEFVNEDELPEGTNFINFDSVEDFEKAISEYQEMEDMNEEEFFEESIVTEEPLLMARAATKNDSKRITWRTYSAVKVWLPVSMWIDFSFSYTGSGKSKKFSKIKQVKSASSNIPSQWNQTTYSTNFYDGNKGVSIKIQGYHLLGVSIGGFGVGAKIKDSYTKKYHF